MPITLTTTGWLPGRTETLRWPPGAREEDQIEVEYRGLTEPEAIHADEIGTLAAASAYEPTNGDGDTTDPMLRDRRKGWLRRLVEAFRMGVVEIRGLQTCGSDGTLADYRPEKTREDGYQKWPMEVVRNLRRAPPLSGLVEVVGRKVTDVTELGNAEKKASSGTSSKPASAPAGTAPDAPLTPGVAAAAATSPPASEPPCSTA